MRSITVDLDAESSRPVVDVKLRSSPEDSSPADGVALIDTGSTMSFIDQDTAEDRVYRYQHRPDLSVQSRGGTEEGVRFYACYLEIVGLDFFFGPVPMASINGRDMPEDRPDKPFVAIIGQDILRHLVFVQDGPSGHFSLTTPTP